MIELLIVILKLLVMLIIGPIICIAVFLWDASDHHSPKLRKQGENVAKQLIVGISIMIVLFIFIFGGIKCLM